MKGKNKFGRRYDGSSRPKADLYECDKCHQWKPTEGFVRSNNKCRYVFSMRCNVCRSADSSRHSREYLDRLKSDPQLLMEAIRKWELKRPEPGPTGHRVDRYYKWLMGFNAFKAKVGLIPKKPPFDIINYVMRKVKYGRLTIEQAEERIEDWYRRHPEAKRTE